MLNRITPFRQKYRFGTPVAPNPRLLVNAARVSMAVLETLPSGAKKLVRMLKRAEEMPAGTLLSPETAWADRLDDLGQAVTTNPSLLSYAISWQDLSEAVVWEKACNTSDSFTDHIWRSLGTMQCLCVAPNGFTYSGLSYNEALSSFVVNPPGTYQAPRGVKDINFMDSFCRIAADANYVYGVSCNSGWDYLYSCYIIRYAHNNPGVEVPWPQGQTITCTSKDPAGIRTQTHTGTLSCFQSTQRLVQYEPGHENENDIDFGNRLKAQFDNNRITGFAIKGNLAAVAYKGQNRVELKNLTTGQLINTLNIASPGDVSFSSTGDLMLISANQVKRYVINNGGTSFSPQNTFNGIVYALALSCNPVQDIFLVADGGSSQQIKAYNAAGTLLWTHGQAGGYPLLGAKYAKNKYWFQIQDPLAEGGTDRDRFGDPFTFLSWEPDGNSWWVLNTAWSQTQRWTSARTWLGQIMYLPDRLRLSGDANDATSIFSGLMQYKVKTTALRPGDPSLQADPDWEPAYHWGAGLDVNQFPYILNVTTHDPKWVPGGNGKVYAQMPDRSPHSGPDRMQLVELMTNGVMRFTGIEDENWGAGGFSHDQQRDGSLLASKENRYALTPDYYHDGKTLFSGEEILHTGYVTVAGGFQNPTRSAPTIVYQVPSFGDRGMDPSPNKPSSGQIRLCKTIEGNFILYKPNKSDPLGFHHGQIERNGTEFISRYYKGAYDNSVGTYPQTDAFGGLDGANSMTVIGCRWTASLYNGQNNGPSNTFDIFDEHGLSLVRFGAQAGSTPLTDATAPAAFHGNNLDLYMQDIDGNFFAVWTVDEAVHAGLPRFRVSKKATKVFISVATGQISQPKPSSIHSQAFAPQFA